MKGLPSTVIASSIMVAGSALADPGVTPDTIVIGQSIGLNGPVAAVAQDITLGLEAYIRQVNARGGIHGRQLVLTSLDDGFVPARAAENGQALQQDAFIVAAPLGTPHTIALLENTESSMIPLLCPFTGAEILRDSFPDRVFHIRASYRDEIEAMVSQLTTLGIDRIALFYQNDAFGFEGLQHLEAALAQRDLEIVAQATYERGSLDMDQAVESISAAGPQAVIMFAVSLAAAEFVKKTRAKGEFPQFLTISLNSNGSFVEALGEQRRGVGNTQVVPYPWNRGLPLVSEYQSAMRAMDKASSELSFNSLEGYLCGKIIGEALERSGEEPTRSRFVAELRGMRPFDAGGYPIQFSSVSTAGSDYVDITVIGPDGRFLR